MKQFTGFKSSAYTEGALFYGERPFDAMLARDIAAQAEKVVEPRSAGAACAPGST